MGPPQPKKTRSSGVDSPSTSRTGGSDSESFSDTPPTAGQILRIELRDFMNHTSLDLDLEPNKVNYITGRNGAGKSSVIQAAVLALGGNAKVTKRATNVMHFIREGNSIERHFLFGAVHPEVIQAVKSYVRKH